MRDPQDFERPPTTTHRLVKVTFDATSIRRGRPEVEHEREVAIYDLIEDNYFAPCAPDGALRDDGPYHLQLGMAEDRLVLGVSADVSPELRHALVLSLTPLKRVMKDYQLVCETYYQAIRTQPPSKIQAIDMGRRGLHDEGSRLLCERLDGKIKVDHVTARRLFTLVCALRWKG